MDWEKLAPYFESHYNYYVFGEQEEDEDEKRRRGLL